MAGDDQRAEKYIMDIPYTVLWNIVQSLDADKGWERLAADSGYTFDKIRLLELEGARSQGSPTRSLLWELGSRNTTVRQLYGRLGALGRCREMKILEDYVYSAVQTASLDNGLRGLKSEPVSKAAQELRGLYSPSMTPPAKKENCSSINLNQVQQLSRDFNNSVQHHADLLDKDKRYSGKQMPGSSFESQNLSSSARSTSCINFNPPHLKPDISKQSVMQALPASPISKSSFTSCCAISGQRSSGSGTSNLTNSSLSSESLPVICLDSVSDCNIVESSVFRYSELCLATRNFHVENCLGQGAFGTVYFGNLRHTKCAVKKLSENDTSSDRAEQLMRELTSLLKYRHENIVTLYGYSLDGDSRCLVYQYMPNGSLEDRLQCKNGKAPLTWAQRINILVGACQGLHYLHTFGGQTMIHGDIKSANILLDKHLEAKIGDLGQAQNASGREGGAKGSQRMTHITRAQASTKLYGTKAYQAPEVIVSLGCMSIKSDVYAMGVVVFEVYSGEKANDERREGNMFLADYFHELMDEQPKGEAEWLKEMDRRAGTCPQEAALALLSLAKKSTEKLKCKRPDSTQLLEQMEIIEFKFKENASDGQRITAAADSLPGSERSCHLSHTSSPGVKVENQAGAPLDSQFHDQKTMHDRCPDKRLTLNTNGPVSSAACSPNSASVATTNSPIDYFKRGDQLPTPFLLQQQYDLISQGGDAAKIRPSCQPIVCQEENRTEIILPSDPAKMVIIEQFDKMNLSDKSKVDECDTLACDPQKLKALKQSDLGCLESDDSQDAMLPSDPKKMAQLHLFERESMTTKNSSTDVHHAGEIFLSSDPHKLAELMQHGVGNQEYQNLHSPSDDGVMSGRYGSLQAKQAVYVNHFPESCSIMLDKEHAEKGISNQQLDFATSQQVQESIDFTCASQSDFRSPPRVPVSPASNLLSYSELQPMSGPNNNEKADPRLLKRAQIFDDYQQALAGDTEEEDEEGESLYLAESVAGYSEDAQIGNPVGCTEDNTSLVYFKEKSVYYEKAFSRSCVSNSST